MINNRYKNLTNFLENRDTASVAAKIRAIQNSMGGISYAEAKNIYDEQNRPSSTPVEEETGGSLLRAGESYTEPESEDKAIEEEVRSQDQVSQMPALPEVPEPAGGQRNMRLLELIGTLGAQISGNRALAKADKKTGQRQAYANLINTLRGSPTASVAPVTPKEGILGTLARGIGGTGRAIRESREAEAAGKADRFGQEMDLRKQIASEEQAAATRRDAAEGVKVDIRTIQSPDGDQVLKTVTDARGNIISKEIIYEGDGDRPRMYTHDGRISVEKKDENTGKLYWETVFEFDQPEDIKALETYMVEEGRKGSSWENLKELDPDVWEAISKESIFSRAQLQGYFAKGQRLALEDAIKLSEKRMGSISERLVIKDIDGFVTQIDLLEDQWDKSEGDRGSGLMLGLMQALGLGFSEVDHPKSHFGMRRFWEESTITLSDALAAQVINIARVLNGGRPSERDAAAAGRLIPLASDTNEVAKAKFQFIKDMFKARRDAYTKDHNGVWRPKMKEVEVIVDGRTVTREVPEVNLAGVAEEFIANGYKRTGPVQTESQGNGEGNGNGNGEGGEVITFSDEQLEEEG